MRGSDPPKRQKHLKISQKHPQNTPSYLYIYLYFYGLALASSRRDLGASRRAPENLDPKKRMLGLAPSIFSKVEPPKTPKQASLATPRIFRYLWGRSDLDDTKIKRSISFLG